MELDPGLYNILPITAFFICLSSSTIIAALVQASYHAGYSLPYMATLNELFKMADIYLLTLSTMLSQSTRFETTFVSALYEILQNCREHFQAIRATSRISLGRLTCFRWTRSGFGIVALPHDVAEATWRESGLKTFIDLSSLGNAGVDDRPGKRSMWAAITSILDSQARMCQLGYFDLSITGHFDPNVSFRWSSGPWLSGPENQLVRYCKARIRPALRIRGLTNRC